ncbi:hypothetical protein JS528_07815 [Bifidobacterium sp. MA2]|uniref:Uncharacterized protein n=1 Tax=Bifidobacterium santillanense TaxID=2809028 RepID=A0ABS5UQL9_9BIFI|nr:hypothetical protein [Bifidobacterium santillanense]MBT1173256.1 hypothetical protein [Bifidobacterium santillanense]
MDRAMIACNKPIGVTDRTAVTILLAVVTAIATMLIALAQVPGAAADARDTTTAATDALAIPGDVAEFFRTRIPEFVIDNERNSQDKDALHAIREDPSPEIGDARMTYLVGPDDDGTLTVTESEGWSAVVRHAGKPTGVATVSRNASSGELEPGWTNDTALARYLIQTERDGGDLVNVSWLHAYFLRKDGTMTALNDAAKSYAPQPIPQQTLLDKLQPGFEDSKAANEQALREGRALVGDATRQENTASGPPWRITLLVAIGTLIVAGATAGFIITRRNAGSS